MEKREWISLLAFCAIAVGLVVYGSEKDSTGARLSSRAQSVVESVAVDSTLSWEDATNNLDIGEPIVVYEDTNKIDSYKKIPEVKVFEPGEHVFMIRYDFKLYPSSINSVSINVPEGYEILDIENYISSSWDVGGTKTQTKGADVWFINNETVEVTPVYNDSFGSYDYSQPGIVIELEETEENTLGK